MSWWFVQATTTRPCRASRTTRWTLTRHTAISCACPSTRNKARASIWTGSMTRRNAIVSSSSAPWILTIRSIIVSLPRLSKRAPTRPRPALVVVSSSNLDRKRFFLCIENLLPLGLHALFFFFSLFTAGIFSSFIPLLRGRVVFHRWYISTSYPQKSVFSIFFAAFVGSSFFRAHFSGYGVQCTVHVVFLPFFYPFYSKSPSNVLLFFVTIFGFYILSHKLLPGADHILAQPMKRCSASRIKPNETLELVKKRQNTLLFWGVWVCGRKNFFTLSPSYAQSPKNREKSLCPTVLPLIWVISTWRDENVTLFVFSACYEIHWNWFHRRKQTKKAKIRKGAFFSQRVLW